MSKEKDLILEVLDEIGDILQAVADGGVTKEVRAKYNKQVNRLQRMVWRRYLKPAVKGLEDDEWVQDAADMLELVELLVRRFA